MADHRSDWKVIADSFFEKALSLAILLMLFAFLVSPKIKVQAYQQKTVEDIQTQDIPPELLQQIKPPEPVVQQQQHVQLDDSENDSDDKDVKVIDTIASTTDVAAAPVVAPPSQGGGTKETETADRFAYYDEPPVQKFSPKPEYPAFAKKMGIQGKVILEAEILTDGTVQRINVLKKLEPSLDQAATEAVRKWRFQPAMVNGKPIAVWVQLDVGFELEN